LFSIEGYFTPFLTGTLASIVGSGKTRSQLHQI